MGCPQTPEFSHPNTRAGTTYHWQRPRSWLAASLCQTGCWARCRFRRHFGSWRESGMVSSPPGQSSSCPTSPRAPRSATLSLPHAQDLLPFGNIGSSLYNPSETRPPFLSPPNSSLLSQTHVSEAMALRGMKQGNRQLGPHERVVLTIPVREIRASSQGREGENGRDCVRVRERGENIGGRIEAGDPRSQSPELGGLLSPQDKTHIRTCPSYVTRAPPDPPRHSAIKPRLRLLPSTSSSLLQCSRTDAGL